MMVTVLGSCVAACLYDQEAGVAGMNHFMLPEDGEHADRSKPEGMRYGAMAMRVLIEDLVRAGGRRERLKAKVFGGGAVLANMTTLNIGDRNSDFVVRYLAHAGIELVAQDLRGNHARRVCFLPSSGKVIVRKLVGQSDLQSVQREEGALLAKIAGPAGVGRVLSVGQNETNGIQRRGA